MSNLKLIKFEKKKNRFKVKVKMIFKIRSYVKRLNFLVLLYLRILLYKVLIIKNIEVFLFLNFNLKNLILLEKENLVNKEIFNHCILFLRK